MNYYKRLFLLALPLIFQHLITVSLNLTDNVMVGRLGAFPLAAVGVANQVYGIYEMILFGLFSGAAVLVAQCFGAKDYKKIKRIFGMDLCIGLSLAAVTLAAVQFFTPQILCLFTSEPDVIQLGTEYIRIASFTYLTIGVSFAIAYNCRAIQKVLYPTLISVSCIFINTVLNYMLIYGHFGMPAMGVKGAAIATLAARMTEMIALMTYLYLDKSHPLHGTLKDYCDFSSELFGSMLRTAAPVVLSEGGWALGVALVFAAYGRISAAALAVVQVSNIICKICQCTMFALGNASAALTGQSLGAKDIELTLSNAKKFIKVQWCYNFFMAAVILLLREPVEMIYDFDAETTKMLHLTLAAYAITQIPRMVAYSVQCGLLRAGGDTVFCMTVELTCNLVIEVILAYFAVLVLHLPLHLCLGVASVGNVIKAIVEYRRYLSKKWINIMV